MALPLPEGTEQTPLTWAWLNRSIQAINWLLGLKVARDCGLTLTNTMAGPVIGYIPPKQALIAKTPAGGIPAMSGTTPGSATCRIWNRGATGALADSLVDVKVYNASTTAVPGSSYVPVERADGVFFAPPPAPAAASTALIRVLSPAGGIAARSGGTPGSASCTLCTWNGTTWTSTGGSLTVKNDYPTAVGGSKLLWVTPWGGDYFTVTEQC
jgi:hypothetical protein